MDFREKTFAKHIVKMVMNLIQKIRHSLTESRAAVKHVGASISVAIATGCLQSCAVQIADMKVCSPIPGTTLAACDNFLTSNPQTLDWGTIQSGWLSQGYATECINSEALGSIKAEIESLCSLAPCDYETEQKIILGLKKIQELGNDSR